MSVFLTEGDLDLDTSIFLVVDFLLGLLLLDLAVGVTERLSLGFGAALDSSAFAHLVLFGRVVEALLTLAARGLEATLLVRVLASSLGLAAQVFLVLGAEVEDLLTFSFLGVVLAARVGREAATVSVLATRVVDDRLGWLLEGERLPTDFFGVGFLTDFLGVSLGVGFLADGVGVAFQTDRLGVPLRTDGLALGS